MWSQSSSSSSSSSCRSDHHQETSRYWKDCQLKKCIMGQMRVMWFLFLSIEFREHDFFKIFKIESLERNSCSRRDDGSDDEDDKSWRSQEK